MIIIDTKPLLTPIKICSPYDGGIDREKWNRDPDTYLIDVVSSDEDIPLPPAKPGEKITVFDFAPLEYGAQEHMDYMIRKTTYEHWYHDPEIQQHAIRYSLIDLHNAHIKTDYGTRPINVQREETSLGRRITAESWREISPFADSGTWGLLCLACAVLSRKRSGCIVGSAG